MDKVTFCVDADPRPTCALDLAAENVLGTQYRNGALQEQNHLFDEIVGASESTGLKAWVVDNGQNGSLETAGETGIYAYTIDKRWRIIQWTTSAGRTSPKSAVHTPDGLDALPKLSLQDSAPAKSDPSTLNRKLRDALADRDDATGRLSNLLKMMEMVSVGMFEYDKEGRLVYGNKAFHNLSGLPHDEDTPMAWGNYVLEEDKLWLTDVWQRLTNGQSDTFDMRWVGSNPAENPGGQWVSAACVPTTDDAGNVITVSGCITDISAQKRSQRDAVKRAEALERAAASEKRFANFIKHSNVAFYTFNVDRSMAYCNREWFELSGHPEVPFDEIDWSAFINAENLAIVSKNWDTMIATKQPTKFQFDLNRTWSDGQGHEMRASVLSCSYPELGEDGSVVAVAGTLTDITYLKWAEKLQKQRTDEAVEAKRQHEAFIDITCHEIRNPLGAVVHCADLISSNLTDMKALAESASSSPSSIIALQEQCAAALDSVGIITSCCAHQRRIVDDILTLSKLDSKLLTIAPSLTDLDNMLTELQKMFEADARKFDVQLRLEKDLGDVQWAMLDTGRLMQVLINLLTNAMKFTQKEAERIVTIGVGVSNSRPSEQDLDVDFIPAGIARERSYAGTGSGREIFLHFTVLDTGCGFDEEQKGRIFERFSQASPRTHSKYGGSGLGLFISREMIELQGGEIGVSSKPGCGAKFSFYISARTANAPAASNATEAVVKQTIKEHGGVKFCILVVEDNLVNQKVLRMQLQKLGHEVHVVNHGGEALEFLKTTTSSKGNESSAIRLSVVLMDIEMPVMNGLECTQKIREAESDGWLSGRLPIIAVSANARDQQLRSAMDHGVDDAITKPFRVADLLPKIERLVLS
ncbi:unnamed protein product [Zymoseptoria tritici ST99CH_3D7]|uniref:histidine kinase n=1 Tax=Zymoseptoria tritici (strain ST99CH_3D7) TaxID=1276538 RepID=A0A1X7RML5_ZYMT9|nr:unnamed protein product [Zymoseptoria tritici ST99CH_3D7]